MSGFEGTVPLKTYAVAFSTCEPLLFMLAAVAE